MSEHPIFWLAARCHEWRFEGGWEVRVPEPQTYLVMGIEEPAISGDINARRWVNYVLNKVRTEQDHAA